MLTDQRPEMRSDGLLVEEIADETLVYDLRSHKAHCLNPTASFVWRHADGLTSVADLARRLPDAGLPANEALVWMALDRLQQADLLAAAVALPEEPQRFDRKAVLRILGKAAALTLVLPAVDSLVAPLAAQAASCLTPAECNAIQPPACPGTPICVNRRKCCLEVRRGRSTTCSPNQWC